MVKVAYDYGPVVRWDWAERYLLITGGRGSGKSFGLALALAIQLRQPGHRILFTRYTLTSAADSIIPEFMEKLELLGVAEEFETVGANVRHKVSGAEILFRGIKTSSGNQTAKLKSLHGITVWVLDEADEMPEETEFDKIDLSVRSKNHPNKIVLLFNPPHDSHWLYQRFWAPRRLEDDFRGVMDGVRHIHTDYRTNRKNLPPEMVAAADLMESTNNARWKHIWLGHFARDVAGALWSSGMFKRLAPGAPIPTLRRVVVAIDPAATSTARADETGVIAAGITLAGEVIVLEDGTLKTSPLGWARQALAMLARLGGDRIVAEVNNGGEMVESTIRTADPLAPYRAVHASRGKIIRAEPVAALYERGMVWHVAGLGKLEGELCTYTGKDGEKSPNRMDALVWAVTDLVGVGELQAYGPDAPAVADGMGMSTAARDHGSGHAPDGDGAGLMPGEQAEQTLASAW